MSLAHFVVIPAKAGIQSVFLETGSPLTTAGMTNNFHMKPHKKFLNCQYINNSNGAAILECAFAFCWVALFLAAMLQILALTDAGIVTMAQVNSEAVDAVNHWKETHMQQGDVERPCLEKIPGGSIKGESRKLPIGFSVFQKKISLKQEVKFVEGKICIFN